MKNKIRPWMPLSVDAYKDLAPQKDIDHNGADSWFLVTHMTAEDGHQYSFLIHSLNRGEGDNKVTICISDITKKDYVSQITNQCVISGKENGVTFMCKELNWDITEQSMNVKAMIEDGKYEIHLFVEGDGTVFGYNTNAQLPLFGKEGQNIQYALPNLTVTGTLLANGETISLSGEGWLDRQWGPLPFAEFLKGDANWLWIAGKLDNGYNIAIWSTIKNGIAYDWLTALSPEGIYMVAPIENSVIDSSSGHWLSKKSGKTWTSYWKANIPALKTELEFQMTHLGQEIFCATDKLPIPNIEASVFMSGIFQGETVSGKGFVEIVS
ncbi:MAG: lipocalin-like domain-containing protein [Brotaphodocola sp.]